MYTQSWDEFSKLVKHQRRFFFLDHRPGHDVFHELLSPQELLKQIAEFCVSHELVRIVPAGTRIHRVRRKRPGERLTTALDLGPPPATCARVPTRMSPAGITMFYGAEDPDTALWETWDESAVYVSGCFEVARDILILDLTNVPRIPSLFEVSDAAETDPRPALIFLHSFTEAVSAPIDRQDRAHVDYVPTQVVAEYFRCFALEDGRRVDGIRYASAQHPPSACYALFVGPEQIILSEEDERRYHAEGKGLLVSGHDGGWLRLVDSSERLVPDNPAAAARSGA